MGMRQELKQIPTMSQCAISCDHCYNENKGAFNCPEFKIKDIRVSKAMFTLICTPTAEDIPFM